MPEKLFEQARGLQDAITFNVSPPPTRLQPGFVSLLSGAVQQCRRVFLRYLAFGGDESERAFDPYGIVFQEGWWYTTGYCRLRDGLRTFRMDRITALDLLDETFERPIEFNALEHVLRSIATMPGAYKVEVLLRGTLEQIGQVFSPDAGTFEQTAEGVVWRREAYEFGWIVYHLLQFDFPVIVRQPPELREAMREVAAKALRMTEPE
jgi:predicted DNA-binding transcriptional regulator YafY